MPNGGHYVTSDWGRNLDATTLDESCPQEDSAVSVIHFTALESGADAAHARIGAPTDCSSEGIAISPAGQLITAANNP